MGLMGAQQKETRRRLSRSTEGSSAEGSHVLVYNDGIILRGSV